MTSTFQIEKKSIFGIVEPRNFSREARLHSILVSTLATISYSHLYGAVDPLRPCTTSAPASVAPPPATLRRGVGGLRPPNLPNWWLHRNSIATRHYASLPPQQPQPPVSKHARRFRGKKATPHAPSHIKFPPPNPTLFRPLFPHQHARSPHPPIYFSLNTKAVHASIDLSFTFSAYHTLSQSSTYSIDVLAFLIDHFTAF